MVIKNISLVLLLGILTSLIGLYITQEIPKRKQLEREKNEWVQKYLALEKTKQKVDTIIEIEENILYKDKPVPFKVYDTIYFVEIDTLYIDTLYQTIRIYNDSMVDENISINYKVKVFGTLEDLRLHYKYKNTTIIKENIVYQNVWYPKNHLYINTTLGTRLEQYTIGVQYLTKSPLSVSFNMGVYEPQILNPDWDKSNVFYTLGFGFKIF